jgi:hypothetical protein
MELPVLDDVKRDLDHDPRLDDDLALLQPELLVDGARFAGTRGAPRTIPSSQPPNN